MALYMYNVCTVFVCVLVFVYLESFHFLQLSISFSYLMQEAEQPLGAGVYTFSKPTPVKQVIDMPAYSDVFQSKVKYNTLTVVAYQSSLTSKCYCTL